MCGICGFSWSDLGRAKEMAVALSHRGPDELGLWSNEKVSFGHTRLKVIDLSSAGDQPMVSDDGQVVLVYNGEIYNFLELRKELESLGHRFRSSSDTEVFLKSYEQWGNEAYSRFNGMWAAAVYDNRLDEIILSRDRIGVKPLYYSVSDRGLIFASELKAILKHGEVSREIDREAVDLLLASQFVPSPWSIFKQIRKLEPRHYIVWSLNERTLKNNCYYEIPQYEPIYDRQRLIQEGLKLLDDAVRIRMVADVPLGAFLSGGIDSTAVVQFMKHHAPADRIHTVGVGFDLPSHDESPFIKLAAEKLATQHHNILFPADDVEPLLGVVADSYDEPVADHSSMPTWVLCEETRKWMTVALSGDGGDEAFGGYASRQVVVSFESLLKVPRFLRKIAHGFLCRIIGYSWSPLGKLTEALRVSLLEKTDYAGEIGASMVYRPPVYKQWTKKCLEKLLPLSGGNLVEAMLKFDIYFNRLGDNYAAKVDRMSMAHALEVRSPLMDYRLMEFATRIPVEWKISSRDTKILFKDMLRGRIPNEIIDRSKKGFAAPMSLWALKNKERLSELATDLHTKKVISDECFSYLRGKVFGQNTSNSSELLKRLAFLIEWHRRWGDPSTQA